jgi:hypothetical protein
MAPVKEVLAARAFVAMKDEGDGVQKRERVLESMRLAALMRGVNWDGSFWSARPEATVQQFLRAGELCVFASTIPAAIKEAILGQSVRDPSVSLLACPRRWLPMRKLLIVHQARNSGNRFLQLVVQVCNAFGIAPTVLTIARDEEQARHSQQSAVRVLAELESLVDFDFLVGVDTLTAATVAARCRRCTHVMLERAGAGSWFPWFRTDVLSRLPDTFTFLSAPAGIDPMSARQHEFSSNSRNAGNFVTRLEP